MLTYYRFLQLMLVLATAVMVYVSYTYVQPLWYIGIPTIVFITVTLLGSYHIWSGLYIKSVKRGKTKQFKIAITFNDGPNPEHTPAILSILKEHNVKATFFYVGERIDEHLPIMLQTIEAGHIVGNHSWGHQIGFSLKTAHNMQVEINKTNHIVQQHTGLLPHFFRPPYAISSPQMAKALRNTNMATIGWSLNSLDTIIGNNERLLNRLAKKITAGDIVLLHDTQAVTVKMLPAFLAHCKSNGIEIVPLNELIERSAYE